MTSRWIRFRDRVVTDEAVYGTVLYAAVIAASSAPDDHSDGVPGDSAALAPRDVLDVLLLSLTTLLVFWVAHVFARTLARGALRDALRHSNGMLLAAVLPTVPLVLGAVGVLPDAVDWSALLSFVVLAFLGYGSAERRGRGIGIRILSAFIAVVLGFVIVVIKIAVH